MKKNIIIIVLLHLSIPIFSQIDELKTIEGENIICKVDSINSTHIFYHYPNEKDSKYISKISTDYIRYSSGRIFKIENRIPYPSNERESFIKSCYDVSLKTYSDTINSMKFLYYCISSLNTFESKITYKDFLKFGLKIINNPNDELILDIKMDVAIKNYNQIIENSFEFKKYENLVNESTRYICTCINQNLDSKTNSSTIKNKCIDKWFLDLTKNSKNKIYNLFTDTTLKIAGEIFGKTIGKDIENNLFNDCDIYFTKYKLERDKSFEKNKLMNRDSLFNEIKNLSNTTELRDYKFYRDRGNIYYYLGEFDKSINDHDKSIELNPNSSSQFFKSRVYEYVGEYDKSIECLRNVMKATNEVNFETQISYLLKLKKNQLNKPSL
jgi:tetratricopeptide (TPR) repeat protein